MDFYNRFFMVNILFLYIIFYFFNITLHINIQPSFQIIDNNHHSSRAMPSLGKRPRTAESVSPSSSILCSSPNYVTPYLATSNSESAINTTGCRRQHKRIKTRAMSSSSDRCNFDSSNSFIKRSAPVMGMAHDQCRSHMHYPRYREGDISVETEQFADDKTDHTINRSGMHLSDISNKNNTKTNMLDTAFYRKRRRRSLSRRPHTSFLPPPRSSSERSMSAGSADFSSNGFNRQSFSVLVDTHAAHLKPINTRKKANRSKSIVNSNPFDGLHTLYFPKLCNNRRNKLQSSLHSKDLECDKDSLNYPPSSGIRQSNAPFFLSAYFDPVNPILETEHDADIEYDYDRYESEDDSPSKDYFSKVSTQYPVDQHNNTVPNGQNPTHSSNPGPLISSLQDNIDQKDVTKKPDEPSLYNPRKSTKPTFPDESVTGNMTKHDYDSVLDINNSFVDSNKEAIPIIGSVAAALPATTPPRLVSPKQTITSNSKLTVNNVLPSTVAPNSHSLSFRTRSNHHHNRNHGHYHKSHSHPFKSMYTNPVSKILNHPPSFPPASPHVSTSISATLSANDPASAGNVDDYAHYNFRSMRLALADMTILPSPFTDLRDPDLVEIMLEEHEQGSDDDDDDDEGAAFYNAF